MQTSIARRAGKTRKSPVAFATGLGLASCIDFSYGQGLRDLAAIDRRTSASIGCAATPRETEVGKAGNRP
jgi:hypothetical protein